MTLRGSIGRLAVFGGLCLASLPGRAEVPANGAVYMDAAYGAVESLMRAKPGTVTLPRLADPVDGRILADVWNAPAILGTAPYTAASIEALLGIIQKQTQVLQAYLLFSPDPAKQKPDAARNAVEFQDELTRSHEFRLKLVAASLQAMNDFGARLTAEEKTDARFQGLRQMRLGLMEIVTGSALALRNPALRPANQLMLARSFSDNAAALAAGIAPLDRKAVIDALQAAMPNLKQDAQKAISGFAATVSAAPCDGLCRLE
ncbi:hypothetical protein SAMN04488115_10856 [Bosea lathyri]|uniref:Uncharacterized protein n=2 Tax=Bosea lathyri TaxID=1036778 RepID=A0A1H6BTL4_9HYPH|nr:hypothetical protein SAMN04488115_10856 [Bosea lathyri]